MARRTAALRIKRKKSRSGKKLKGWCAYRGKRKLGCSTSKAKLKKRFNKRKKARKTRRRRRHLTPSQRARRAITNAHARRRRINSGFIDDGAIIDGHYTSSRMYGPGY